MSPLVGCTIIALNYLARARVLAASFAEHEPGGRFYVLIVDGSLVDDGLGPRTTVVTPDELDVRDLAESAFKYDLVEFATRLKPPFLRFLIEELREDRVIYFDPDMVVTRPLEELERLLERSAVVLTPHLLRPIPDDGLVPSEQSILRAGAYNLGFIALRRSPEASRFLAWWDERLEDGCVNAPSDGLFVDQRWVDLVPGLFPGTAILRDETYNVAYWNLADRHLTASGGRYRIDGRPLALFHFSGFDPDRSDQLSKYQNRIAVTPGSPLADLLGWYRKWLGDSGQDVCGGWEYRYDRFDNGVRIFPLLRKLYARCTSTARSRFGDPFATTTLGSFFAWATTIPRAGHQLSPFLQAMYDSRTDLARRYPNPAGPDRPAFLAWARADGAREHGYDPRLVPPGIDDTLTLYASSRSHGGAGWASGARKSGGNGVNVCGYLRSENGLGAVARGYLDAIESRWIPTSRRDISALSPGRAADRTVKRLDRVYPYGVNLVCANADEHPAVRELVGEEFFRDRYNIGVWFWELPEFPDAWHDRFARFDEIWVASAFMANALGPVAPIPVLRVPPVLTPRERGIRLRGRRRLGATSEEFVFLLVFDFLSYPERKNPLAAIESFRRAFGPAEPARLVLKCVNADARPDVLAAMRERAEGRRVSILDGYWNRGELHDLVEACDAYVSLHRAEGLGLTLAEAMAVGKPVIATGWSGNLEFMNVANSYLVRYDLVRLDRDVGPYRKGQVWADPSIDHAAELMRRVYEARDEGRERGRRARQDLAARYSDEVVGTRIAERLELIYESKVGNIKHPTRSGTGLR